MDLRRTRRDRAARLGPELFLFERAFDDCLERIQLLGQRIKQALLIGCPDRKWPDRIPADHVVVVEPGPLFAQRAGGEIIVEDQLAVSSDFDLVLAIGTLDTVNDLPLALALIRRSLRPRGLFIGAVSGGDTLPQLRSAMRAADAGAGRAAPHVHPRIEASALAPLLERAGFVQPVVDIDRVPVSYQSFAALVTDLRAMGATNILNARSRHSLSKTGFTRASEHFDELGSGARTIEVFEILHFMARSTGNMVTAR